jgi:transposase
MHLALGRPAQRMYVAFEPVFEQLPTRRSEPAPILWTPSIPPPSSHDERGVHEPEESIQPKRKRRKFTPEFKAEALRIVRTSGKSIGEVAREFDLTETCLRTWVLQAQVDEKQDPQGALTTDERAELVRLRRELRTVEQERDFLKKLSGAAADIVGRTRPVGQKTPGRIT